MNTEKFFEVFTELDDDLIENALPQTQNPEIVRPGKHIRLWKPIAAAAAAVAVVCGIAVGMKIYSSNRHIIAPVDSTSDDRSLPLSNTANSAVNYSYIQIDERVYFSAQELIDKSDIVALGKVTNISFELHDQHTGELLTEYSEDAHLCTVYDVDIITSYKGNEDEKVRIIMYNGLKDYKVDEQISLVGRDAEWGIPVLDNPDEIYLGEEYLFLLSQSFSESRTGDTMTNLINHSQGVFRADQPTVKERYSQASLNDIIGPLAINGNLFNALSVTHNNETMPFSDQQTTAIRDAVMTAVLENRLPEYEVNTVITEQDIEEYGKNGYAVTVRYNDIDEPLYEGVYNKKSRTICDVTVLIGEQGKPSYISYSYTFFALDGASEPHDGGTFYLNEKSRDSILQSLNP